VLIRRDLDRGAREALSRGEPVLTAAGLVGVVDQVGPVTSTVRLLTDPRTSLMVQIITRRDGQWRPGPEGVCRGSGDGATLTVEGISRTSDVAPGDFIVTSPSPEAALPPYLVVGRVARCHLKPAALFYDLVVEPRVAAAEAGNVYVLSRPADETKP
jgi:cell shape-determining protein MreC